VTAPRLIRITAWRRETSGIVERKLIVDACLSITNSPPTTHFEIVGEVAEAEGHQRASDDASARRTRQRAVKRGRSRPLILGGCWMKRSAGPNPCDISRKMCRIREARTDRHSCFTFLTTA
jgi:hypothetical protein